MEQRDEIIGVVNERQAWVLSQSAVKLFPQFAHSYGIWRAMYHVQEAIQLGAVQGQVSLAFALLVQLCRALHQCALDNNSWSTATLLLPTPDPSRTPIFGGSTRQLQWAASWQKAAAELQKATVSNRKGPEKGEKGDKGDKTKK